MSELKDLIKSTKSNLNMKYASLEQHRNEILSNNSSMKKIGITKYLKSNGPISGDIDNKNIINVDPKMKIPKSTKLNSKFMTYHELEIPKQIPQIETLTKQIFVENLPSIQRDSSETFGVDYSTENTPKTRSLNTLNDKGYYSDTPLTGFSNKHTEQE